MKTSVGRSPRGALSTISRPHTAVAPIARKASRCGSRRRRPITSPPGGGIRARPKRASSGPASRNDARICSASSESTSARSTPAPHSATSWSPRRSTRTPTPSRIASIASTSRMRGTLRTTTSSSVRTAQARIGSAPFLFPAGSNVPDNGAPPSMTNFSMGFLRDRRPTIGASARPAASVTAISTGEVRAPTPRTCSASRRRASRAPVAHPMRRPTRPAPHGATLRHTPAARPSSPSARPKLQDPLHSKRGAHRTTKPFRSPPPVVVRTFASIRPTATLLYEHVFCSLATSTLAQRTRGALALTRAFLLLEDDDPVDWEVDREDRGIIAEPPWARAHRTPLRERRAARRPGQPRQRPQVCVCPIASERPGERAAHDRCAAPDCPAPQRGSRITTGSSRVAIDL